MKSSASRGWGALLLYRGTAPPSFVSFFPTRPILVGWLEQHIRLIRGFLSMNDELLVFVSTNLLFARNREGKRREGSERKAGKGEEVEEEKKEGR